MCVFALNWMTYKRGGERQTLHTNDNRSNDDIIGEPRDQEELYASLCIVLNLELLL